MLKLEEGDKVAIIAPASHLPSRNRRFAKSGVEILESWGLEVLELFDNTQRHFYLAGDDQYRSHQLLSALEEPDVKAVFVTRGGYGCTRLLPALSQFEGSSPRLFCGYSDITALNLVFEKQFPSIQPVHGPGVFGDAFAAGTADAEINQQRLHDLLFYGEQGFQQKLAVLAEGKAIAAVSGGCLSIIISLLGTAAEPDFSGKILFLEDVGEKPYAIDRMLTQLLQAGKLSAIKGLVFGDMTACSDDKNDLQYVISDVLKGCEFPVLYGLEAGHGPRNYAFRYGQMVEINSSTRSFCLLPHSSC